MNFQDPAAVAAYIGLGATGFLGVILRMRKMWIRDNRDVSYDVQQTEWVKSLQTEIKQLRVEKEAMFVQRLADVREIVETKALNEFLTKEVERLRRMMESMETNMRIMKRRLQSIDSTISTTDFSILESEK